MIIRRQEQTLVVTTQPDHARLAAELLSLWRSDGLPDHPRRQELLIATREHDNGWREADSAPQLNPATRKPHTFATLPDPQRRDLWRRGVQRYLYESPYVALLIVQHGIALHRDRGGCTEWDPFLEEFREIRASLLDQTKSEKSELAALYRLLKLADGLSLAACKGQMGELSLHDYVAVFRRRSQKSKAQTTAEAAVAPLEIQLRPFPFAGATTFAVACRLIPDRRYKTDSDFAIELARAPWESASIAVTPTAP